MSPGTTQKSVLLFQRREQAEEEEIGFSSRGHFSHLLHPFWSSRVVHPTFRLGKRKLLTIFPIGGYFEAAGVANYRLRLLLTFFLEYFLRQGSSFPISEKSSIQEKTEGWIILVSTAWESIFSTIFPHTLTGKDQRKTPWIFLRTFQREKGSSKRKMWAARSSGIRSYHITSVVYYPEFHSQGLSLITRTGKKGENILWAGEGDE